METNKLERLQDLVTSLERMWLYDEAEELQEYLLNPEMNGEEIFNIFKDKLEDIYNKANWNEDGTDCYRDEDGNQYENEIVWLQRVLDTETIQTKYKDIVKYDEVYMFRDNVLDRWMVRGQQWLWLSNIEKDEWTHWYVPQDYIKKRTGVVEKIRWMPRIQEFTLKEYNKMLEKKWIDIQREEVIEHTHNKNIECPDINMLEDLIGEDFVIEKTAKKEEIKIDKENISEFMKKQLISLWIAIN